MSTDTVQSVLDNLGKLGDPEYEWPRRPSTDSIQRVLQTIGKPDDPRFVWPDNRYSLEADDIDFADFERYSTLSAEFTLDGEALAFVVTMAYFVNQAIRQNRERAFLGQIYGRISRRWGEGIALDYCHVQAERKEHIRLTLLRFHREVYMHEPPCDWEYLLSLNESRYQAISKHVLQLGKSKPPPEVIDLTVSDDDE
ncbi:hypothetical protein MD484_g7725, partial [Candolleomyces efflorescens]